MWCFFFFLNTHLAKPQTSKHKSAYSSVNGQIFPACKKLKQLTKCCFCAESYTVNCANSQLNLDRTVWWWSPCRAGPSCHHRYGSTRWWNHSSNGPIIIQATFFSFLTIGQSLSHITPCCYTALFDGQPTDPKDSLLKPQGFPRVWFIWLSEATVTKYNKLY